MSTFREAIKDKKRIVVKIGSSSLQHSETGDLDYIKLEKLVRAKYPQIKNVVTGYVGPVIGAHTGPGVLVLFFVGEHR